MTITTEIKEAILKVTGEDRQDCINKVAELLGGQVGAHMVEVKTSSNVVVDNTVIDLSTKKKSGHQTVKCFYTWEIGKKNETIELYI